MDSTEDSPQKDMEPRLNPSLTPRFWELDPIKAFQPLCKDILEQEPGIDSAEEYGKSGQSQFGIDILGKDSTGRTIVVGQCKCYEDYTVANVTQAGNEFYKYYQFWKDRGVGKFILIVACDLIDRNVQDEIHKQYTRFESLGIYFEAWSGSTLRNKLMPYPEIAQRHIHSQEVLKNICGPTIQGLAFTSNASSEKLLQELRNALHEPDRYYRDIEDLFVTEAKQVISTVQNSPLHISDLTPSLSDKLKEYLQLMIDASEKLVRISAELIKSDRQGRFNDIITRVFNLLTQDTIQYQGGYISYTPGVPGVRLYPLALMIYNLYIIGVNCKSTNLLKSIAKIRFRSKSSELNNQRLPGILWQMYYRIETSNFFKIIEPNVYYPIPASIENNLSNWLKGYVDFPIDAYYCGEFILGLTMLDSNNEYLFPSRYLFMSSSKDVLQNFIMTEKRWLQELFPDDIESRLQTFDQLSSKVAQNFPWQRAYGFYGNALNLYQES